MTATIYRFPDKEPRGYKISLFNDQEVEVVLMCVNIFSDQDILATYDNLGSINSKLVVDSLAKAKESWIFSENFKKIIKQILGNVEVV